MFKHMIIKCLIAIFFGTYLAILACRPVAYGEEESDNVFDKLGKAGFSLGRALYGPGMGEAATFSLLKTFGDGSVYSTDFALSWSRKIYDAPDFSKSYSLQASVEGSLTSDESESMDALKFSFSLIQDYSHVGPFDGIYARYALKHESDQDFETRKVIVESEFTPTMKALAIGVRLPEPRRGDNTTGRALLPPVQFRWRPFFGLEGGITLEEGNSSEKKDTVLRLPVRVRAEVFLNFLKQTLGIQEGILFLDNIFVYLPLEDDKEMHNFLIVGLELRFTKNISAGFTYKDGEAAPVFNNIETFGASIGIRF
ncbi:MAG: hypothetical protein OEY92_07140 [Elusimicrobiota bacterium]|nr:hypothetical protein [Elusimicrobiota bacterium]